MHDVVGQRPLLDGRYEVQSVLGGGASAVVYLAHQAAVGRQVAIKVLREEVFTGNDYLDHYLQEARIVASLNHPHIVTLFDVGRLRDGRPYMVMEFVKGQSLNRTLRHDGYFPVDLAFQVFLQVAQALAHAHRNGVVHRDIKPGNILLEHGSTGRVRARVADFGIASSMTATPTTQQPGILLGTPLYMSPEQAQGFAATPQSDIYSLGVVMYRLLSGQKPFQARTPLALAMCHVTEHPKPLLEAAPHLDIPPELARIVARCMEKEREDRYPDCQALIADLLAVRVKILPHLVGLSQESMEPRLLDTEASLTLEPPRQRTVRRVLAGMVALASCFAAGVVVKAAVTGEVAPEIVEIERVVEVPMMPPETVVYTTVEPAAPATRPSARAADAAPVQADAEAPATVRIVPVDTLRPLVGEGGIGARWAGDAEGKPVELTLQPGADGRFTGELRYRSGPTWSTRELVGSLEARDGERVRLEALDVASRQPVAVRLDVTEGAARGTLELGGRSRALSLTPR